MLMLMLKDNSYAGGARYSIKLRSERSQLR